MRIASTLAVCLLLFAGFRLGAAADLGTALVVEAGADCLGYVRIENPKIFLEKLDAVTGKFGSRVSDDLPLFAQRYLKNPLLSGIEMTRPWTFVFLNPRLHTNNLAIVVGVNDTAMFYDSFGKGGVSNVKPDPAGTSAAIHHFTEAEDVYDHQAYLVAVRAGQKVEPLQFRKQVTKHYYVTVRAGQGMIVGNMKLLDESGMTAATPSSAAAGDIVAALRAPAVLSLYEDDLRRQKESILAAIGSAAAGDAASRAVKKLAAEFDAAVNFFKHISWLEAGAELGGGQIKLRIAAPPLAGSAFSRALAGQQPLDADTPLLSLMPADVAMLGTMHFTQTPEWTTFLLELMRPVIEASAKNSSESSAKLQEVSRATWEAGGGAFAAAVLAPATNQTVPDGVEVVRVSDTARARQAQRTAVEAGLPVFRTAVQPESCGKMKYESNVARYAGVGIDRVTMDLGTPGDPVFGTNFVQEIAFTGGFELIAQGPHCTNNIRRLIVAATTPSGPDGRGFKITTASFPKKQNGIFYLNLAEYIGHLRNTEPAADDAQLRRLQTLLAEAKADLTAYLILEPRAAVFELNVPLDKLIDVFNKSNAAPPAPVAP